MTGLERIIEKIESDSRAACDELIKKASDEARGILESARQNAETERRDALSAAAEKCGADLETARSGAELRRRQAVLAAKTEIIGGIIAEAVQTLENLPDGEYFDAIETLVIKYAQAGEGVLRFSKKDLARMPEGFESRINAALSGGNASVTISAEPYHIGAGFILVYGDIEQNCTFEAIKNACLDELSDELYDIMFRGGKK